MAAILTGLRTFAAAGVTRLGPATARLGGALSHSSGFVRTTAGNAKTFAVKVGTNAKANLGTTAVVGTAGLGTGAVGAKLISGGGEHAAAETASSFTDAPAFINPVMG